MFLVFFCINRFAVISFIVMFSCLNISNITICDRPKCDELPANGDWTNMKRNKKLSTAQISE